MIALVQRVLEAAVRVDGQVVGAIGTGLLVLVCAEPGDTELQATKLVDKLLKLRVFADASGKMNRSVVDVAGGLLLVSQFTLAPMCPAATGPALPALLIRCWAVRFMRQCCAWQPSATRWWLQASLVPTCRSARSTTGR